MVTAHCLLGDSIALMNAAEGLRSQDGAFKLLKADASVTDPPYGISFDGGKDSEWDTFEDDRSFTTHADHALQFQRWTQQWATPLIKEILWPGASIAMFGMDRAIHRATSGLEDAGFQIRHGFAWLYATGQAKQKHNPRPGWEPITFGRKPFASNEKRTDSKIMKETGRGQLHVEALAKEDGKHSTNVIGQLEIQDAAYYVDADAIDRAILDAAPFWYVPKPSKTEREAGLEDQPLYEKESFRFAHQRKEEEESGKNMVHNHHPTVKPIALMRRIIRLVSRPGHTIIDPFMGSGTTGVAAVLEGRNFIGIEREPDFHKIASARIAAALLEMNA